MENDLIFGAETGETVFTDGDTTQLAAAASPSELPPPAPADAGRVVVPQGETVVRVSVAPGEIVELPFPADAHFLARIDNGNLAIKVGDLTIILQGYVAAAGEKTPVIEAADGRPLDIAAILAATDPAIEIETAAGPSGAQGGDVDNTGALLTPFSGADGGLHGFAAAGGQEGSDTPGGGPGVDQTGTLFRQFGETTPTAPTAADFKFATDEESKIAGKVVATDPQGDPLTYTLVGAVPAGLTFNQDGGWRFDPAGKYDQLNTDNPGQVSFQYKANDGAHDSNTATVTIDIEGINDAPKLAGVSLTGLGFKEDEPNHEASLNWDIADPDDTHFTFAVDQSTLPPGVTFDTDTQTFHFDTAGRYDHLEQDEAETFVVKITVTDAHGGSFEQDFKLQAIGVNDAPVAVDDLVLTNAGTGTYGVFTVPEWALLVNDKDVDSKNLDAGLGPADSFGFDGVEHLAGNWNSGEYHLDEDGTLGGWFTYRATDGTDQSEFATVTVQNREGGDITGTDADEILVGGFRHGGKLDGGGGNDILMNAGGSDTFELYGGAGDDILQYIEGRVSYHGGTDNVAESGGLAADAANRGDVLVADFQGLDLAEFADKANADGIETISSQEKFGGGGAQTLTVTAAGVAQISDHTITPGDGFGEHKAIRIDSDHVDEIYLLKDGGEWVDTGIEMVGYRIYAHETSADDPASTDAYVMVQLANTDSVHVNPPVVQGDRILTTAGSNGTFTVPDWALLANDSGGEKMRVTEVIASGVSGLALDKGVKLIDDDTLGGYFDYKVTDGSTTSAGAHATFANTDGNIWNGGDADEILIGTSNEEVLTGGGGNDIIIGGGAWDKLSGEAGDDIIALDQDAEIHGGDDTVAASGGLAAAPENHGDVLAGKTNLNLMEAIFADGIETLSTEQKFGGDGAQVVTIDAASVMALSDHSIAPGGDFAEHEAIRIDGDAVDRLYLSNGSGGGQWVDTGIDMAGYRIYAHETTAGDPDSTEAYVMVAAANTGNVHLNQEGTPVAVDDIILTNLGVGQPVMVPEWALTRNDTSVDGAILDVGDIAGSAGAAGWAHAPNPGANGKVSMTDDADLGMSLDYQATDGATAGKSATVDIRNQAGGAIIGTAASEIIVGSQAAERIEAGGGNDIIFGGGGGAGEDEIFGGGGDDIIAFVDSGKYHGETDSVAASGGLASDKDNHGDILLAADGLDLTDAATAAKIDGIETISMQDRFGGIGDQALVIDAAAVRQISDHTITPGGGFGEHAAIRVDGDGVDQVYLSTANGGGQWVDTGIEMAGYRIYAHEAKGGGPASADAYVMVMAANTSSVHIPAVASDDVVRTNVGTEGMFTVPEWALLANDAGPSNLDVAAIVTGGSGLGVLTHNLGTGSAGDFAVKETGTLGGSFEYQATDGSQPSEPATVTIQNQDGGDITGTAADEILVGGTSADKIDGGAGNDIIVGGGGKDEIFGGAGDDILAVFNIDQDKYHGGTDNVAASGGLAASAPNHGDVLVDTGNLFLADSARAASIDGIETISTEAKFGAVGSQDVTIGAAGVQQLSDHTITPGGVFAEHEAIRIDGDLVDELYLSISKDGGQWVDTAIETAGYRIFAHETTAGDAASTDAYVMVKSDNASVGNVHLNQDAP